VKVWTDVPCGSKPPPRCKTAGEIATGRVADETEMRPPVLFGPLVADAFHRLGRGHQIGEQDRHDRRLIEFGLAMVGR